MQCVTCDHVVQIEPLDEHPHEHGSSRVLQQNVGRLTQPRLQQATHDYPTRLQHTQYTLSCCHSLPHLPKLSCRDNVSWYHDIPSLINTDPIHLTNILRLIATTLYNKCLHKFSKVELKTKKNYAMVAVRRHN